ncbi:MAG: transcriptional regulator [Verrucomicrobia bacterium]|nr:MAG: transcriptional regulator [Verrucomicrobiota bacterium]
MKKTKQKKLKAAGWTSGTVQDFLDLSDEEVAFIEMKLALANTLKKRRIQRRLTQAALAKMLESSQSRVAKMEAADSTVSLDLLVRALLALGATRREVAKVMAAPAKAA